MDAKVTSSNLSIKKVLPVNWFQRIGYFVLFLACGLLVFLLFSHYFPMLKQPADTIGRIALGFALLAAALFARRSETYNQYWLLIFAFFAALTATSIDRYLSLSKWILPALNIKAESPEGWTIEKLESSLLSIVIVLALNWLAGQKPGSLYIRRGNLWLGLGVGLLAFVVMIATVVPVAETYFKGYNLTWPRLLGWAPVVLIFILANASNEELVFRGLFIGKMEPFAGKFLTNLATTIPFVVGHAFTSYSADVVIFVAFQLLPLALGWCWLMQKSNSIWGSILFHAAMDIPIVVGIFSNLQTL